MAEIKHSHNTARIALGEHLPLNTPFTVILSSSEVCNFRCNYCFRAGKKDESWSFAASNENMSSDIFELAVKQLGEFPEKIKLIELSGQGEPLCNPRLENMAQTLKQSDIVNQIMMHTNASLLTEERAKKIAHSGFTRIIISLQGLTSQDYKRVCDVEIDWDKFYKNLKVLYENRQEELKIHIKIPDVALNQGDEAKFYSLFENISDTLAIENVVPIWKNINIDSKDNINKYGGSVEDINYCSLLFYKLFVAPNGDVYPCTRLPAPKSLGNIRERSLLDVWNSDERKQFLIEHLQSTRHGYAPCEGCYIPVNTITSSLDIIDPYKDKILSKLY